MSQAVVPIESARDLDGGRLPPLPPAPATPVQADVSTAKEASPGRPAPLVAGTHRYRLGQKLRSEWAGGLYEASEDPETSDDTAAAQRIYALRLLPGWLSPPHRGLDALSEQVERQQALPGDHLLRLVAVGFDAASSQAFVVSEWCAGETLDEVLRQRDFIPPAEAAELLLQLCAGLGAAHAQGLWHGGLKPASIVLTPSANPAVAREGDDGSDDKPRLSVKLASLGLLPLLQALQPADQAEPQGTPLWMAPEQTSAGRPCGVSSDIWALGLLVFRMLTGQHYFLAGNARPLRLMPLLREVTVDPLVPASRRARELGCESRLPPGFDLWFSRCVVRAPTSRFLDAQQAFAALAPLLAAAVQKRTPRAESAPVPSRSQRSAPGLRSSRPRTPRSWRYALGLALLLPLLQAGLHARGPSAPPPILAGPGNRLPSQAPLPASPAPDPRAPDPAGAATTPAGQTADAAATTADPSEPPPAPLAQPLPRPAGKGGPRGTATPANRRPPRSSPAPRPQPPRPLPYVPGPAPDYKEI
ncbi:MAG TPA: protein kinase [Pseudomonadota bacterium]|nr:protein kinase [Pseudomonadota bacterium]